MNKEELNKLTKEEIVEAYNKIATEQGKPTVETFASIGEARKAYNVLTKPAKEEKPAKTPVDPETLGRGPVQGVGKFAKELLLSGMANKDVLAKVKEQFPSAKTSSACIGFYRTKLVAEGLLTSARSAAPAGAPAQAAA